MRSSGKKPDQRCDDRYNGYDGAVDEAPVRAAMVLVLLVIQEVRCYGEYDGCTDRLRKAQGHGDKPGDDHCALFENDGLNLLSCR
jgi:hypothetical protein